MINIQNKYNNTSLYYYIYTHPIMAKPDFDFPKPSRQDKQYYKHELGDY